MSDPSNICLSCGLCCDGTLIGFVQLQEDEIPAIKELMEIEEVNDTGFFLHPCKKYCNGCTIYENRPRNCDKFNCGLLKSVQQKELSFESAVETIDIVKQKKISIEKRFTELKIELKSPSFYFKMVELKKVLEKIKVESSLTKEHLELISDLEQLDILLSKKFGVTLD